MLYISITGVVFAAWLVPRAIGAWLAIVGAIAVLASSIIGTEREWVPEYP